MKYEDLIKRLRVTCGDCKLWDGYKCCLKGECSAQTRLQAADTIEELQKAVMKLEDESGLYDELPTFYIYPTKMSILIKDMEMPDRCFACPLCDVIDSEVNCAISHGSYIEYREIAEQTAINGRSSDCPLIPVPPHGRLIDADALIAKQQEDADLFNNYYSLLNAVANIANAPTIIPADEPKEE